jgi:nitrous oxidase accessory protein NosD
VGRWAGGQWGVGALAAHCPCPLPRRERVGGGDPGFPPRTLGWGPLGRYNSPGMSPRVRLFGVAVVVLAVVGLGSVGAALVLRGAAPEGPCAARLRPGDNLARALEEAPAEGTVCLAAGTYGPLTVRYLQPGVTLRGEGSDRTLILGDRENGLEILGVDRFTLAALTVRGGSPAGIYAAGSKALTLRDVRVESAAIALHLEGGATTAELMDVTLAGSREFGLLVRRGASVTATRLRVPDHRGIGVGATDAPGTVSLRDAEVARIQGQGRGEGLVLIGFERFTLTNVTVRGGNPAGIYAGKARELRLQGVRVEGANFGLHLDDSTVAVAEDVTLAGSTGVGLLLQRGGTIDGRGVRVLDTHGTGVSAINGAGAVRLRDGEIARVAAAGLFAGNAGCADLPPASLAVPDCFLKDLEGQVSGIRVALERVRLADTRGPCLVFFPGVRAEVRESHLTRCELTGLFAWGATVDVRGTVFENNAEHALEYRAYPDPRGAIVAAAEGAIEDSVVRGTRPLEGEILGAAGPGPVLGGGILAQGARLAVRRTEVSGNRDIGIAFVNGSSGEVTDSRIADNGNVGLCVFPGSTVTVRGNTLAGNRSDNPNACGGL